MLVLAGNAAMAHTDRSAKRLAPARLGQRKTPQPELRGFGI